MCVNSLKFKVVSLIECLHKPSVLINILCLNYLLLLFPHKRLEKEMESHVAAMAAEVQHLVDRKIPETTRSALQENAEVKARFSQLSQQTQVLMGENSTLRDCKSRLSVDVDILEQMLSETSRQSCIRKKARGRPPG